MPSLYEINDALKSVFERIADAEGEITPELEQELNGLEIALEEKAAGYCAFIAELNGEAAMLKAEEERIAKRRKAVENKVKGLRERLLHVLKAAGLKKLKAGTFNVTVASNAHSVQVDDIGIIPHEYKYALIKRVPMEAFILLPEHVQSLADIDVDKARIKAALKDGGVQEIPGVHLEQIDSLRIS